MLIVKILGHLFPVARHRLSLTVQEYENALLIHGRDRGSKFSILLSISFYSNPFSTDISEDGINGFAATRYAICITKGCCESLKCSL